MDVSVDEIFRIRDMSESEVKSIVLEKLREMKKQEFEQWINSKLKSQYETDMHIVIMKNDDIGMSAFWKAFNAHIESVVGEQANMVVMVAFSFDKKIKPEVNNYIVDNKIKIILLNVEEMLEKGFNIETKIKNTKWPKGVFDYLKFNKDKDV
ncbi:MAG: hypothetical protein MIO93_06185 [ANME-2 cluster archaeon]|jgi:hypothetical protein|nr:hypothetical protein [ANME-2 cluster archaeon]